MKVLLSTLNAKYIHSSLALRYLESYCRKDCPGIAIREYTINNRLLEILSDIYSYQPKIIGFACYIWNIDMTLALAALIKKVLPDTAIILGGPEVSYDPGDILARHDVVDYIVMGEGEEILRRLLVELQNSGDGGEVAGVAFRRNGSIIINGGPQLVTNLDDIPFPYSEHDLTALKDKIVYYESSRGCPFSCSYCLSSATSGVRFFSLERVYRDLAIFIRYGVKQVKFVDRTFNAKKSHYVPLMKFLAAQDCTTNFHFEVAADILDDEVLSFLKTVPHGRFQMEIGVQSTYEPTLAEIHRKNIWPKIVKHVTQLRSYGNMHLHLDLIVGLPYEDFRRFGRSFDDVYDLKPHMLQIGFLKMLKGSGIRCNADAHGYIFTDYAPYEVLANKYLTYSDVRFLQIFEEMFNQVYNSGRFSSTLERLIEEGGGSAFTFYEHLTAYWERQGLHKVAHSTKSLYRYIGEFCQEQYPGQEEKCRELLKFDALLSDKGAVRPEWLPWNGEDFETEKSEFWRAEHLTAKYISGFKFTTWREVKRLYHIEVFPSSIIEMVTDLQIPSSHTAILFDYRGSETVYKIIAQEDFWVQEEAR